MLGNKELILENKKFWVVKEWIDETYNGIICRVPIYDGCLTEKQYKNILREYKLKRILI
jgi:hypothetical protein